MFSDNMKNVKFPQQQYFLLLIWSSAAALGRYADIYVYWVLILLHRPVNKNCEEGKTTSVLV